MLAEVAPAAPGLAEAALGAAALATLLACAFLIGVRFAYYYSLGAVLRGAARLVGGIPLIGSLLSSPFDAVDHAVLEAVGRGILATEWLLAKEWYAVRLVWKFMVDSMVYLAQSTEVAISHLVHATVPTIVQNVVSPVRTNLGKVERALVATERALSHDLTATARALEAEIAADFGRAWRGIDAVPGKIKAGVIAGLVGIDVTVAELRAYAHRVLGVRLSRLEKLLGAGVITGVVAGVLTKLFPFWQCSNVKKVGRALCRFPSGLLDMLLLDALEAGVLLDICRASKLFAATARAFEPELVALVSVTNGALQCSSGDRPPDFALTDNGAQTLG